MTQSFLKRHSALAGTGWDSYRTKLTLASATVARGAEPFWVGVELTHPACDLGYVGVFCVDRAGEVLCTRVLQERTSALEDLRTQWPGGQLRFLTDVVDLRKAARRSIVFGAVVDAGSSSAVSLAVSLAKAINDGNTRTALRVLTLIAPPLSRRSSRALEPLPPTPAPFDVLLKSRTTEPWYEHRDLATMCAVQKAGLIGVDFNDVCGIFRKYKRAEDRWVSKRPRPVGAKASGIARGRHRAASATRIALRSLAESLDLSQARSAVIDIGGDARSLRLAEYETVADLIAEACPRLSKFVPGDSYRKLGEWLSVNVVAVTGGSIE